MKKALLIALGLGLFFTVSCRLQDLRELTLNVPDMHNEVCRQIVVQALARGPGLQPGKLRLDPDARVIHLTYDSLLAADKNFEYLVAKAGFAVNGIPADEAAKAALPPEARR